MFKASRFGSVEGFQVPELSVLASLAGKIEMIVFCLYTAIVEMDVTSHDYNYYRTSGRCQCQQLEASLAVLVLKPETGQDASGLRSPRTRILMPSMSEFEFL